MKGGLTRRDMAMVTILTLICAPMVWLYIRMMARLFVWLT